jgi:Prophage minor tail protein Z (GPZ)
MGRATLGKTLMIISYKSNFKELAAIMRTAGDRFPVILSRATNKVAGRAKTKAIRAVHQSGGFATQKYVRDKTRMRKATPGMASVSASITMESGWSTLAAHRPAPKYRQPRGGNPFRRARPWGELRKYDRGFWVTGANGAPLPVVRVGKGRGSYKVLYGANPARELQRPEAGDQVNNLIALELPIETIRYAKVYFDQQAARLR